MKVIKPISLREARGYKVPGGYCYLYPDSPTGRLSCALVEEDGNRYPATGFRENRVCTEAFFVIEGEVHLTVDGVEHVMNPYDVIYVPPRTPYAVQGKGKVFVFIEPQWNSTQNVASE